MISSAPRQIVSVAALFFINVASKFWYFYYMKFLYFYVTIPYSEGKGVAFTGGIKMYQAGEWVVYGIHGVCRVVGTEKQLVNRKRTQFLVLEPLNHGESRFYLPTENATAMAKLKEVLSKAELEALLVSEQVHENMWIHEESRRKQYYRELIGSGDRIALMKMVSSLYRYKTAQLESGKKFHQSDDNFLRDAERLLSSEIALVMELSMEEARNYLRQKLQNP